MKTLKSIKHGIDWLLARIIVGAAGATVMFGMFVMPAMLAELLCRAVGLGS